MDFTFCQTVTQDNANSSLADQDGPHGNFALHQLKVKIVSVSEKSENELTHCQLCLTQNTQDCKCTVNGNVLYFTVKDCERCCMYPIL